MILIGLHLQFFSFLELFYLFIFLTKQLCYGSPGTLIVARGTEYILVKRFYQLSSRFVIV